MKEQLNCGEKYTLAIFQEADGIMIVMQGKDRIKCYKQWWSKLDSKVST